MVIMVILSSDNFRYINQRSYIYISLYTRWVTFRDAKNRLSGVMISALYLCNFCVIFNWKWIILNEWLFISIRIIVTTSYILKIRFRITRKQLKTYFLGTTWTNRILYAITHCCVTRLDFILHYTMTDFYISLFICVHHSVYI